MESICVVQGDLCTRASAKSVLHSLLTCFYFEVPFNFPFFSPHTCSLPSLPLPPPPSSAVSLVHFVVRMLRREMKSSKKHTWRLLHAFTRCSRASSSTLWTSTGEDCVCVCVRVCLHVCVPRYVYRDLFLYDTYSTYILTYTCCCLCVCVYIQVPLGLGGRCVCTADA